jgi:nifR3 family TIM-barrel protein
LSAVREATDLPLTVKLRSGWDYSGEQAFQIAQIAQNCGVDAVIMHPRTAGQGFKGRADWGLISKLKQQIAIPVIGNGDINSVEDAVRMLESTGCDGVMVGRAAMINPFLPSQIDDFLETGSYESSSNFEIFRAMESLTEMYVDYFKEESACKMLRSRLSWFVKAMPGCSDFRKKLTSINSKNQIIMLIKEFEASMD